jgi:uncharacterized membrane protein YkvA (DUF1232 family)
MKNFITKNYILLIAVLYLIWPIDLIPDIPPFGYAEDTAVVILGALIQHFKNKKEKKKSDVAKDSEVIDGEEVPEQ